MKSSKSKLGAFWHANLPHIAIRTVW